MQRLIACAVLCGWIATSAVGQAANEAADNAVPSPLLSIDQNRNTVVDRIVLQWGAALEQSNAELSTAQLREMLAALRADHLLAASLAGSLVGLRDVLATAANSHAPSSTARVSGNALGSATGDLVYTPVAPCRLFDTRTAQGGIGTLTAGTLRTYGATAPVASQGGPGGCAAGAGAVVAQIQLGSLTPTGSGLLQGGPQGVTSFPNALLLYQPGDQYGTAVAMPLNTANGQFTIVAQFAATEAYGDLLGYFRPATGFSPNFGPSGLVATAEVLPTQPGVPASFRYQYLSNGQTAIVSSSQTGVYFVTFPLFGSFTFPPTLSQTVQVTASASQSGVFAQNCAVAGRSVGANLTVEVDCVTITSQTPVDTSFFITVTN